MVDLLREPQTLIPAEDKCVIEMEKRNDVLERLLVVRRNALEIDGAMPQPHRVGVLQNTGRAAACPSPLPSL